MHIMLGHQRPNIVTEEVRNEGVVENKDFLNKLDATDGKSNLNLVQENAESYLEEYAESDFKHCNFYAQWLPHYERARLYRRHFYFKQYIIYICHIYMAICTPYVN